MAITTCPACGSDVSDRALTCSRCGHPMNSGVDASRAAGAVWRGFEWRTRAELFGWPVIHVAFGRDSETGKLLIAKGIIAVGQFGIGLITIAQFGVGLLFAFGQFTGGLFSIGQFAAGICFGLGQFATGATAIGQIAFGKYVLAQLGYGEHVWSTKIKDPVAIEYFQDLWTAIKGLAG